MYIADIHVYIADIVNRSIFTFICGHAGYIYLCKMERLHEAEQEGPLTPSTIENYHTASGAGQPTKTKAVHIER